MSLLLPLLLLLLPARIHADPIASSVTAGSEQTLGLHTAQ
jgi:hypothetical protein